MKVIPGQSIFMNKKYEEFVDEDGYIDTDELSTAGLPWKWNEGDDGPVLAGPNWEPTISVPERQPHAGRKEKQS